MAEKVTSVAIEFGLRLEQFKRDLQQNEKIHESSHKAIIAQWTAEEKRRMRLNKRNADQRSRDDQRAAEQAADKQKDLNNEIEQDQKRLQDHYTATRQNIMSQIPVFGDLAVAIDTSRETALEADDAIAGMAAGVGVAAAAVALLAAGAVVGARAILDIRSASEDARIEMMRLNRSTGLTVETLNSIRLAGGDDLLSRMGEAAGEFNKRLSDARRGTGELLPYLKAYNVQIVDSTGNLRTSDAVLRDYVTALQEAGPSADTAAAATGGLGGAGRDLMAAFGDTSFEDFTRMAEYFGADVSVTAMDNTARWAAATQAYNEMATSTVDLLARQALGLIGIDVAGSGLQELFIQLNAKVRAFGENMARPSTLVQELLGENMLAKFTPFGDVVDGLGEKLDRYAGFTDKARTAEEIADETRGLLKKRIDQILKGYTSLNQQTSGLRFPTQGLKNDEGELNREREKAIKLLEDYIDKQIEFKETIATETAGGITFIGQEDLDRAVQFEDTVGRYSDGVLTFKTLTDEVNDSIQFLDVGKLAAFFGVLGTELANTSQEMRARLEPGLAFAQDVIIGVGMVHGQIFDAINTVSEHQLARAEQLYGRQSGMYQKFARQQFMNQKALAISNMVIAGAQAIVQAYALNPIFGAVMVPVIAATTATQIAVVASQQPPNVFHTGGMIPSASAMAPDEVGITALSGEGVVSRRGMDALESLNRGEAMGQGAPVVVFGARVFDAVQGELAGLPNSAMQRAIRARTRRRIGHRS